MRGKGNTFFHEKKIFPLSPAPLSLFKKSDELFYISSTHAGNRVKKIMICFASGHKMSVWQVILGKIGIVQIFVKTFLNRLETLFCYNT